tara:strand:+ start:3146 stop:3766 length:621 start_codon:yes stop_codon:yes gene_type:complete
MERNYMPKLDKILKEVDYALNILFEQNKTDDRDNQLDDKDKKQSQRVMRVNHMGEVCAQGLYRGQALTSKDSALEKVIINMCDEEKAHLELCNTRLDELSGHKSYLNPLWYLTSFALGAYVGTLKKDKALGFIYETERQVEKHLDEYTQKLPNSDMKSKELLHKIKLDETKHKNTAKDEGSVILDDRTKKLMSSTASFMKRLSFYI